MQIIHVNQIMANVQKIPDFLLQYFFLMFYKLKTWPILANNTQFI